MGVGGKAFSMKSIKKSRIHTTIYDKKELIFNIDFLSKHIENCKSSGVLDFSDILSSTDILQFLRRSEKLDEYFDCIFINGSHAWVSKDNKGHYRYFTRSNVGVTYSLDTIDLMGIYHNQGLRQTISTIRKKFNIAFNDEWTYGQRQKYEGNKSLIDNEDYLKQYPNLYKLIKNHLNILQILNELGLKNLVWKTLQFNDEALFFLSTRYLRDNFNISPSTSVINQVVNLFAILGLIDKVSEDNIPAEFITIAKERMKIDKSRCNHITFYTVADMGEALEGAEKIAEVLVSNNLKYHAISKNTIKKIFGEEFANRIYVQKVYGGLTNKKGVPYKHEVEMVKHYFNVSVIENGFVSKELLKKDIQMSEKLFNKLWTELTGTIEHIPVKPNKNLKKKHNLLTNEQVIIVRDIYNSMAI